MLIRSPAIAFAALLCFGVPSPVAAEPVLRRIGADEVSRTSAAVVVPAAFDLVHTTQILPLDARGEIIGPGQADTQSAAILDRLDRALREAASGLDRLVKLNVYASRPEAIPAMKASLARLAPRNAGPSISFVEGELADPGALLAIDAVAATSLPPNGDVFRIKVPALVGQRDGGCVAVLSSGCRVFISGQADPGTDLTQATLRPWRGWAVRSPTWASTGSRVVQVKAFLTPMSSAAEVERAVRLLLRQSPSPAADPGRVAFGRCADRDRAGRLQPARRRRRGHRIHHAPRAQTITRLQPRGAGQSRGSDLRLGPVRAGEPKRDPRRSRPSSARSGTH